MNEISIQKSQNKINLGTKNNKETTSEGHKTASTQIGISK